MKVKLVFEIPSNDEIVAKLIEAVPPDWAWLDGMLTAPDNLKAQGFVLEETGFSIGRFHSLKIIGRQSSQPSMRIEPDIYGVLVEQKLPGFILFDEAGFSNEIKLELAKEIAISFVRKFYCGTLFFYKNSINNNKFDNSARCNFFLGDQSRKENSSIELKLDDQFYGRPEDVEMVLSVCRNLKLKELISKED